MKQRASEALKSRFGLEGRRKSSVAPEEPRTTIMHFGSASRIKEMWRVSSVVNGGVGGAVIDWFEKPSCFRGKNDI